MLLKTAPDYIYKLKKYHNYTSTPILQTLITTTEVLKIHQHSEPSNFTTCKY